MRAIFPHKKGLESELAADRTENRDLLSQLHPTLPSRALTQTSGSQIPRTQCGEEEMAISARPLLASALLALLLSAASAADSKNNPADQLVALINSNRTASKASTLADNQGLGCIALQYIKAYEGQCNQVGENKKPVESSFVDTFAPNCGVQAATLSKITGRLLACQSNYVPPAQAFDILIDDAKSLQVLHDKNHTEVGAAVSGTSGGGPYFWCVLFSSGKPNTRFKVDGGVPKTVHPGCFSGNNDDCSGAISIGVRAWRLVAALLFAVSCAFTL